MDSLMSMTKEQFMAMDIKDKKQLLKEWGEALDEADNEEESEELFMIPCCHCGFRFERDTRMHDNAICDDDDNWFCEEGKGGRERGG